MDVGFKTDVGLARSNNEDAYKIKLKDKVFVIADGVGGNNSGEIASTSAVNEISDYIEHYHIPGFECRDKLEEYFRNCVVDVNAHVLDLSYKESDYDGMATTVVILYIEGNKAFIVNVGDSRAYIMHNGEFVQITEDHTYVNTLVKKGIISEREAEKHEHRNMITRAVGAEVNIEPDFFKVNIEAGDILLLCTDGLYEEVEKDKIIKELKSTKTMTDVCNDLVNEANNNGGHDNITVVAIKVTEEDFK